MILWKAHTHMVLPHNSEDIDLNVVSLGRKQIILGMPWLKSRNSCINWRNNTLSFTSFSTPDNTDNLTPQQYLLRWLRLDADMELSRLHSQ